MQGSDDPMFSFSALEPWCRAHKGDACNCVLAPGPAVQQSLEELEFQRSACAAAQAGNVQKLAAILKRTPGAVHSDGATGSSGYTPLHYAARAGHLEAVKLLLNSGADVNAQTSGGATALHRAAGMGHTAVVRALLAAGGHPLVQDSDGETPLHKSAAQGHTEVCKLLLQSGPPAASMRDRRGLTPLERAGSLGHGAALAAVFQHSIA